MGFWLDVHEAPNAGFEAHLKAPFLYKGVSGYSSPRSLLTSPNT